MWEEFEERARARGFAFPVGLDEAGRGPLAGPVVAACCYIPRGVKIDGVNDSKKLTEMKRKGVAEALLSTAGVKIGIAVVGPEEIDQINILNAALEGMLRAAAQLDIGVDYLLVDGNRFPKTKIAGEAVVRGDGRVFSIAAASVIAKVHRDELMLGLDELYPEYGFRIHKGYPTKAHREAIERFGLSPVHRKSFRYSPTFR